MAPRSGGCAELPPPTEVTTQPLGSATPAVFAAVTALDCHCHGRDLSSTEGTEGSPEASLDLSPKPPQHLQCFANGKHGLAAAPEGVAFSPSATAYPGGRTRRRRPPCQRGLWRPPAAHGSALAKSRCDCTARQRPFPAQPAPAESRAGTTHARKPSPYFGRAGTLRTMRSGCRPRKDSAAYPPAWWALCAVAAHSLRAAAWPRAVAPPRSPPSRRGRPGCPGTRTHHPMRRWLDERLPVSTTHVVAPP